MQLINGEALAEMARLPDASIDAIITDPPYGTTACKWDSVIPFEPMWTQLKRIIKPRGAIVLFGSQPFTSALIMSNVEWFKYCWVWDKKNGANPLTAKIAPIKTNEDIAVFGDGSTTYYPVMVKGIRRTKGGGAQFVGILESGQAGTASVNNIYYPKSILAFSNAAHNSNHHPTQKPVRLMEYLIKTYTLEGQTVLDFTMGSGTTGVACKNTGREFIGIELDEGYYRIAQKRIAAAVRQLEMF